MSNSYKMAVSYTRLSTFLRCRAKYHWQYILKLKPKITARPLVIGGAGHTALAAFYNDRKNAEGEADATEIERLQTLMQEAAWNKFWSENPDQASGTDADWEKLDSAIQHYPGWAVAHDDFRVVDVEQEIRIPIPGIEDWDFLGYVDLIVEQMDKLWIIDHKFSSRAMIPPELDLQTQMYSWAVQEYYNREVGGTFYNVIRMGTKIALTEPVLRGAVKVSPGGHKLMLNELKRQCSEMTAMHAKVLPVYRHVTSDCAWDCPYQGVCLALQEGFSWKEAMQEVTTGTTSERELENV